MGDSQGSWSANPLLNKEEVERKKSGLPRDERREHK
jgi:hypothetical protein